MSPVELLWNQQSQAHCQANHLQQLEQAQLRDFLRLLLARKQLVEKYAAEAY
jgi:hypothetical protein